MEFPHANFPTQGSQNKQGFQNIVRVLYITGVTGHMLYWITWEAMRYLEGMNLKVL